MEAASTNNPNSLNIVGDLDNHNVAVQPIKRDEGDEEDDYEDDDEELTAPDSFMNEEATHYTTHQTAVKRKVGDEHDSTECNPELTIENLREVIVVQQEQNQVAALQQQLLQQQQSRISKKSKLRRHSSNAGPYVSGPFPPSKIIATNPPMLLSYRKKWIDITKHIQSNYNSLNKKERKRVVHDLFSDSLHMGKVEILKEGEGWSGGYNISGVRRGDMGNGVSQLLSQGFLRL